MVVSYPITVRRSSYRGADPRKKQKAAEENSAAALLEKLINERLLEQTEPIKSYMYYELSELSGMSIEVVRRLCFSIDGGHNGLTAVRKGMTYEAALAEMHGGNV
jgi:hypothetical protein